MTLNDIEKRNYINNYFHQYFTLELNTTITTTETVNLVIPIDSLRNTNTVSQKRDNYHHDIKYPIDYDINSILDKYEEDDFDESKLVKCLCTNVIDGDTFLARFYEENSSTFVEEKVRLVGINTPETGKKGADVSKEFIEKLVFSEEYLNKLNKQRENKSLTTQEQEVYNNKFIYIQMDSQRSYDVYGRRLAILTINDKNINKIMLQEGIAEIEYVPPSEFNPFEWGDENTEVLIENFKNDDITVLSAYFNPEMTNIVFTPKSDWNTIYRFEVYKGVIYVKMKPFSKKINMHLLPPSYDCSNNLLIFRDNMITEDNLTKTNDYYYKKPLPFINSYYLTNNKVRDRTSPDISSETYNVDNWLDEYLWPKTYCEFSYDISPYTRTFENLEICAGYTYNNSTPFYSVHYTGVRDNTNIHIEDRCTLVDANYDKIEAKTNNVTQYHYTNDNILYIPKKTRDIKRGANDELGYDSINHVSQDNIGVVSHKIIKYINDNMYSEENRENIYCNWVDLSD